MYLGQRRFSIPNQSKQRLLSVSGGDLTIEPGTVIQVALAREYLSMVLVTQSRLLETQPDRILFEGVKMVQNGRVSPSQMIVLQPVVLITDTSSAMLTSTTPVQPQSLQVHDTKTTTHTVLTATAEHDLVTPTQRW
jgi:hypothetical protein